MSNLSPKQLPDIKGRDPVLYRILKDIVDSHNAISQQVNANPTGAEVAAPPTHSANSGLGGNGVIDMKITDNSPQNRGVEHFMDIIPSGSSWQNAQTIHIGASTNWRGYVGKGKYQVRTYAQFPNSPPSDPLYHPEIDTTGVSDPAMQSGNDRLGYGQTPYLNSVQVPKRQ